MILVLILIVILLICMKQIYYGYYVIPSTAHNRLSARSYLQFLASHRTLSVIIENENIARIIMEFCGYKQKIASSCPGKHGLIEFKCDSWYRCDICRKEPKDDDILYGCRKCDYDVCVDCYVPGDVDENEDMEKSEALQMSSKDMDTTQPIEMEV